MTQNCGGCRFFKAISSNSGDCRRHPETYGKWADNWCGEFEASLEVIEVKLSTTEVVPKRKRCPFCGNFGSVRPVNIATDGVAYQCGSCNACGPSARGPDAAAVARMLWERRI